MEKCDQCQRMKNRTEILAGKLRLNTVLERLWQYISVDFVTKLPISRDYDSILVVCDRFSKMLHFIVTTAKIIAKGLAKLFRDNVWKLYGFKVIYSFLSTDKQANQEDKSRARIVLENIH